MSGISKIIRTTHLPELCAPPSKEVMIVTITGKGIMSDPIFPSGNWVVGCTYVNGEEGL